ncbi:MAG TPA: helix-turn-helix transcriptional regulator [Acidimicrobiales bacterium]|nr:helix-turn-helix transcriptional regulator [Acidimicrobiales bacterium]
MAFGQRVRALRVRAGLSQEALAERSGIHRTYLSGLERGERNVGLDNILAVASALDVPVAALFEAAP